MIANPVLWSVLWTLGVLLLVSLVVHVVTGGEL